MILVCSRLFGQSQDSTVQVRDQLLEEIEISAKRLSEFASGDKISQVLPNAIGPIDYTSMAEILTRYSAINVRSYGVSGLSTASLRGTGSNHTAVFWEGVNLQSSMNGSLDLTLLPMSFIDQVSIQYGSAGAAFGTGAMGGAIHLSSAAPPKEKVGGKVFQHWGSFASIYTGVEAAGRINQLAFRVRAFNNQVENDFPFYNRFTRQTENRQHAGIQQQGVLSEVYFSPHHLHQFSLKYWYQDNEVEVPNTAATRSPGVAMQYDQFHRAILQWQHQQERHELKAHTAILYHDLVYDDNLSSSSQSQSISWISELEDTWYISDQTWVNSGVNYTYETAVVESYGEVRPERSRTAAFISLRTMLTSRLESTLGIRETLINRQWSPFLPSLGLSYQLTDHWSLKSKNARSYRVPTFNDLYWAGAGGTGNPALVPEKGWSHELGLQFSDFELDVFKSSLEIGLNVTLYSNSIDQWISWIPVSGTIWTPINVEKVWARGGEASSTVRYSLSDHLAVKWWSEYTYTKSTKEAIEEGGSISELHKQLIYTPYHQFKSSVGASFKALEVGFSYQFTGSQYATSSNQLVIPYYYILNFSAGYTLKVWNKHRFATSLQINNLSNTQYEVRSAYPMPGRNYHLSFNYHFN